VARNEIRGGSEHLVLTAVPRLKDTDLNVSRASGVSVKKEIEQQTGRSMSIGYICTTLDRLEKRGLLKSEVSDRDGRRPKRFYSLTKPGQEALIEAKQASESMWNGLDLSLSAY
jgi:PadR family transcriptional regulator PadR